MGIHHTFGHTLGKVGIKVFGDAAALFYPGQKRRGGDADGAAHIHCREVPPMGQLIRMAAADIEITADILDGQEVLIENAGAFENIAFH